MAAFEPGVTKTDERVTVVGASGYIGKAVVRECVRRGYATTAVVRDASKASFDGATTVGAECADLGGISRAFEAAGTDVVDFRFKCVAQDVDELHAAVVGAVADAQRADDDGAAADPWAPF